MSDKDIDFIKKSGLTRASITEALSVSKQALSNALNKKNKDYFTDGRLFAILRHVEKTSPDKLDDLKILMENEYGFDSSFLNEIETQSSSPIEPFTAKEMWVISNNPYELQNARMQYMERMKNEVFSTHTTVIYIIGDIEKAHNLSKLIEKYDTPDNSLQCNIYVIYTPSIKICPHMSIFNPRKQDMIKGYVEVKKGKSTKMARMTDGATNNIANLIYNVLEYEKEVDDCSAIKLGEFSNYDNSLVFKTIYPRGVKS